MQVLREKAAEPPPGGDVVMHALTISGGANALGVEDFAAELPDEADTEPVPGPKQARVGVHFANLPANVWAVVRDDARPMRTFGSEHAIWGDGKTVVLTVKGALVRVYPPAGASDGDVSAVRLLLAQAGALAVRVMPLPAADVPVPVAELPAVRRTVRVVVHALAEPLAHADKPGLLAALDEALDAGERACPPAVRVQVGEPLSVQLLQGTNWLRFRGSFTLNLCAGVYGITATTPEDPARSNWQGKSSIVEAIAFALYGWHRWPREDDWITRGESEGIVFLVLSDGTQITRKKKRGKSVQLEVTHAGEKLNQEHAQKRIEELLGLSGEDFFSMCFVRQKQLARLVTAKPAPRLEIVRGWLELEPLVAAEDHTRKQLDGVRAELGQVEQKARWTREEIDKVLAPFPGSDLTSGPVGDLDGLTIDANNLSSEARQLEETRARRGARIEAWERDARIAENAARVRVQIEELRAERAEVDEAAAKKKLPKLAEAADLAFSAHQAAVKEGQSKLDLARGAFDGRCPVAVCPCPIADEINADRERNAGLAKEAQGKVMPALQALQKARAAKDVADKVIGFAAELDRQIAGLERQLTDAAPSEARMKEEPTRPAELVDQPGPAWELAREASRKVDALKGARARWSSLVEELVAAEDRRCELDARVSVLRSALQVLGKNGAQKAIAVGELGRIEAAANALLAENGIDLTLAIRWGRESSSALAVTCEDCGTVFPTSQKVKACTLCGATRGPKLDDKLDLDLSDRSGAAEDLAGLALQLAASGWLRERRGARWSCVVLDEPFGALDEHNGRALAVHLAGMIRGKSFRQGFVIAHSAGAMAALPGRIVVTGGADGSTVEVLG